MGRAGPVRRDGTRGDERGQRDERGLYGIGRDWTGQAQNHTELPGNYGCESGYFVACFYVLINLTLFKVQTELEDPFE